MSPLLVMAPPGAARWLRPPVLAPYLEASRRADRIGVVLLLALQVSHGAGIKVARSNGNVLGEWIFSFQGAAHSPQSREQVEDQLAFHLFLHSKGKISPSTQKNF